MIKEICILAYISPRLSLLSLRGFRDPIEGELTEGPLALTKATFHARKRVAPLKMRSPFDLIES